MMDIESLEKRVQKLEQRAADLAWVEREILNAARQYARLTTLGYAISDEGQIVRYSVQDGKELAEYYQNMMSQKAIALLRVETAQERP